MVFHLIFDVYRSTIANWYAVCFSSWRSELKSHWFQLNLFGIELSRKRWFVPKHTPNCMCMLIKGLHSRHIFWVPNFFQKNAENFPSQVSKTPSCLISEHSRQFSFCPVLVLKMIWEFSNLNYMCVMNNKGH